MTSSQLKVLSEIKKLVKLGKRKFAQRKDCDYLQDLLEIGITEEEAWNQVLYLNKNFWFIDPKPSYSKKSDDALLFKKQINGILVYIKIKIEIENDNEMAVCLSFHKDWR